MAYKKSNNAGDKSNFQESLLEGIADDIDFAVPENEVAENILAVDIDANVNCSSIEKNVSDAAVFATVRDDNSDDDFVKPHTSKKSKKVIKPNVNWSKERHLTCKISVMTTRIEKNGQVQDEAQFELKKSQKKVKRLEKQIKMLMKNNHQLERKMEASKKENEGILVVVKKSHHEAGLSKKEARRLLFENARFSSFVSDKEKKLSKDLDACELKFVKIKERF